MSRPDALPVITRKHGNPNWGRFIPFAPALPTEFEMQTRQLQLTPEAYVFSSELRNWCDLNGNRLYIPEWLLDAWNLRVNADR